MNQPFGIPHNSTKQVQSWERGYNLSDSMRPAGGRREVGGECEGRVTQKGVWRSSHAGSKMAADRYPRK